VLHAEEAHSGGPWRVVIPLDVRVSTSVETRIQRKNIHIKEIAGQFHVGQFQIGTNFWVCSITWSRNHRRPRE